MDNQTMQQIIDAAFDDIGNVSADTQGDVREAVNGALDALDGGSLRVAEKTDGDWQVNQWLKKAVLLSFRLNDMSAQSGGPQGTSWWDKVPSKFAGWGKMNLPLPVFAPSPIVWCAARPILRRAWC